MILGCEDCEDMRYHQLLCSNGANIQKTDKMKVAWISKISKVFHMLVSSQEVAQNAFRWSLTLISKTLGQRFGLVFF